MAGALKFNVDILAKTAGVSSSTSQLETLQSELKQTSAQIKVLEAAQKQLQKTGQSSLPIQSQLQRLRSQLASQTSAFVELGGGAENSSAAMQRAVLSGTLLATVLTKVASLAAAAGRALVAFGVAAARRVYDSVKAFEGLRTALSGFLGGSGEATVAIEALHEVANRLGVKVSDVSDSFAEFVGVGFTRDAALEMVKFQADVIAFAGTSQEKIGRIRDQFRKLGDAVTVGKIEMDALKGIVNILPINGFEQLAEVLGPKLGKNAKDTLELLKNDLGKVPVQPLIDALKEASLQGLKMGEAGEFAANKTTSTLSGAVDAIQARFSNALGALGAKLAPQLQASLGPMLDQLNVLFDSPEFHAAFSAVAGAIISIIEGLAAALPTVISLFQEFGAAFSSGFGASGPGGFKETLALFKNADVIEGVTRMIQGLGAVLGFVTGLFAHAAAGAAVLFAGLAYLVGIVEEVGGWFAELGSSIAGAAASLFNAALSLGSSIVDGIVAGIRAGIGAVIEAASSIASAAIDAATAVIRPGSPSIPMTELAETMPAGIVKGIDKGMPSVEQRMAQLVTPPAVGAAPSVSSSNTTTNSPTVIVQGGNGTPQEIEEAVFRALSRIFGAVTPAPVPP